MITWFTKVQFQINDWKKRRNSRLLHFRLKMDFTAITRTTRFVKCHRTVCFRELDKLTLIWWFDFSIEPIFSVTHQTASKMLPTSKVVKSEPEIKILSFSKVKSKSLIHIADTYSRLLTFYLVIKVFLFYFTHGLLSNDLPEINSTKEITP